METSYAPWVTVIGRRPAPMDEDYGALIAAGHVQVIESGKAVLAVLVTWPDGAALHLDTLAVDPGAQGRGLGRQMIAAAEDQARDLGLDRVELYTNALMASNIALYRRLGFKETHRARDQGFDRVYFAKAVLPRTDAARA